MQINIYTQFALFKNESLFQSFENYVQAHPNRNFFQSSAFFEMIEKVTGYKPFLMVAQSSSGTIIGSLLGVFQFDGRQLKSWLSRRVIVWSGPLATGDAEWSEQEVAKRLLKKMKQLIGKRAIYAEFRNFFDTTSLQNAFLSSGFEFKPHLNFLVKTDTLPEVKERMNSGRMRQVKSSLKLGAIIAEPENESEIVAFYQILQKLYKEKVKKPLPHIELFIQLWKSPPSKIFLIKYEGAVVGGIACPIYANEIIYEWYVCGEDGAIKGLHPSVLATWAPIEYGVNHGFDHFDFMGAGRPDQDYGVREFKSRFGGQEVCFGRYEMVLNKPLYEVGKFGLRVYQKMTS